MPQNILQTQKGFPQPFGATPMLQGVNFALYSKHASDAALCLFEFPSKAPFAEISLDPHKNRTGDVWHILVKDLPSKFFYAYRLAKRKGRIFCQFYQEDNLILDPYAKLVNGRKSWGNRREEYHPLGEMLQMDSFDWENDRPLQTPIKDLVIYEMHVRGFTQHPSSNTLHRGTFEGIIEKIPHLHRLGINAIKLLPIQEFDECDYDKHNPETGERLLNFWGYATINFFSPTSRYAADEAHTSFKSMVKELHKNGIEVILDMVFNHTGEGNLYGPTYSFKGIDPNVYYLLDKKEIPLNFSGCGNTVNCNHPIVREWIRDCLHYWVSEMHVDGFRFDLAAIFARGLQGEPLEFSPIIEELSQDPILAHTKLIAEPWDAAGLYQLGHFYPKQERWSEWNDKYRDAVRKFLKGDRGVKQEFAARLCGSQDLFWSRSPAASLNFITAHDGFTLRDLVSYNEKQNRANGEGNRDGTNANYSWNCGEEGFTSDSNIERLRERQMRNFHVALMISQGVPMVQMGDEYGHTRKGNNNSWCQDNDLNWFLWDHLDCNRGFFRFYQELIRFRRRYALFRRGHFLGPEDIVWHGTEPFHPDWHGDQQTLAFTLKDPSTVFYIAFNTHDHPMTFHLPKETGEAWKLLVNTAYPSPNDFCTEESAPLFTKSSIELESYSCVIFFQANPFVH